MFSEIFKPNDRRIIFSPSEDLSFYIQQKLYERYPTHGEYRIFVETESQLADIVSKTVVPPLIGDYWAINIRFDAKKTVSKKFLDLFLSFKSDYAFITIWVSEYRDLMTLMNMQEVFSDRFLLVAKLGFLSKEDARTYYNDSIRYKEFEPPEKVVDYLIDNYRFDVKALSHTIALINGGREILDTKELIRVAGLGRTTVDNLLFKLLTSTTKTTNGTKKLYAEALNYIENLNTQLEYRTILNFMLKSLEIMTDIKQLQMRGIYKNLYVPLPKVYDADRMARYNRFEYKLKKISLVRILNLRLALTKNYDSDSLVQLLKGLSDYMDFLYSIGGGDKGEQERKDKAKAKREKSKELKIGQTVKVTEK